MLQTCAILIGSIRMASFQRPFEGRSRFAQSWFLGFEGLFFRRITHLTFWAETTVSTVGVGFEYFLYIGVDDLVDKYFSDGLNQLVLGS